MGLKEFNEYLEKEHVDCFKEVDLLEEARRRNASGRDGKNQARGNSKFRLVIDVDSCLQRLYSGYYTDWVCGGQWNRMVDYLSGVIRLCVNNNIELIAVFNGTAQQDRLNLWKQQQLDNKCKVAQVLSLLAWKGTPPPKVWWVPPHCLSSSIRLLLCQPNVILMSTIEDHHTELVQFYNQNECHGLITNDLEYLAHGIRQYYLGCKLKFYKGNLTIMQLDVEKAMQSLNICFNSFSVLTTLLGNHILTEDDLKSFHQALCLNMKNFPINFMKSLVAFVAKLPSTFEPLVLASQIFGLMGCDKLDKFVKCVHYYRHETKHEIKTPPASSDKPAWHTDETESNCDGSKSANQDADETTQNDIRRLFIINSEVLNMAAQRHRLGYMNPWIYQVLTVGEIKFSFGIEEETPMEFPSVIHFYRPIRQIVYSILLGSNASPSEKTPVLVKEWGWSKHNPLQHPDVVLPVSLGHCILPIDRLWFSTTPEDNKCRMQAFLTCMRSDTMLLLMKPSYIPQQFVILCTVLRYMMTNPNGAVLRKLELNSFLAQAVSSNLQNTTQNQSIEISKLSVRGVLLASLFMQGVENALFANDACGSPIPPSMCCPWLFFDGKLFQEKLAKAVNGKNIIELCDGHIEEVATVEKLREAILDGLRVQFAHTPLINEKKVPKRQNNANTKMVQTLSRGQYVPGGHLQVAGMVVGTWGANYGQSSYCRGMPVKENPPPPLRKVGMPCKNQYPATQNSRKPCKASRPIYNRPFTQPNRGRRTNALGLIHSSAEMGAKVLGMGRGCTVETKNKVIDINQLVNEKEIKSEDNKETECRSDQEVTTEESETKDNFVIDDTDFLPQFSIDNYIGNRSSLKNKENAPEMAKEIEQSVVDVKSRVDDSSITESESSLLDAAPKLNNKSKNAVEMSKTVSSIQEENERLDIKSQENNNSSVIESTSLDITPKLNDKSEKALNHAPKENVQMSKTESTIPEVEEKEQKESPDSETSRQSNGNSEYKETAGDQNKKFANEISKSLTEVKCAVRVEKKTESPAEENKGVNCN